MTNEEKIELRREVCARMLYGLKALATKSNQVVSILRGGYYDNEIYYFIPNIPSVAFEIDDFKIYLRPMSSMTEEEKEELKYICTMCNVDQGSTYESFGIEIFHISRYGTDFETDYTVIDWLLAHHFDFRGLIDKGLALPAPDGMYND